ncbi:MAG: hypothetical protein QOI66_2648 [Myxococcales bacterium]|nr:hypothetical protein [Myxococcales bacterium]
MRHLGHVALLGLLGLGCTSTPSSGPGPGGTGGANAGSGGTVSGGSGGTLPVGGSGGQAGGSGTPDAATDATAAGGSGGASPTDAAPTVDAGDGAAGSGGSNGSCAAPALYCDDFEKYTVGADLSPNWTTNVTGGTVRVDTVRASQGKQAAHFTTATGVTSMLQIIKRGAPVFPLPGNKLYGRMMFWLSQTPTEHFNIIEATGPLPGMTRIAKYAYGGKFGGLMAAYTIRNQESDPPTVDCGDKPSPPGYVEKQWICVEWTFDGSKDEMHLSLDGRPQTAVDVVKTGGCSEGAAPPADGLWHAPTFDKLFLGFFAHPFNVAIDVFIDDVVISTAPIGCPKSP